MLDLFPGPLISALVVGLALLLALVFVLRPSLARGRGGFLLASIAIVAAPLGVLYVAGDQHLQYAKSTEFCVSCHVMDPYGASLVEGREEGETGLLAATHYLRRYVPPEKACYSCHTQYTMYGDIAAKMNGLQHVWVNYVGEVPDPIALYQPYSNRECLHCHASGPSFLAAAAHEGSFEALREDELSCLACHADIHGVEPGEVTQARERSASAYPLPDPPGEGP